MLSKTRAQDAETTRRDSSSQTRNDEFFHGSLAVNPSRETFNQVAG